VVIAGGGGGTLLRDKGGLLPLGCDGPGAGLLAAREEALDGEGLVHAAGDEDARGLLGGNLAYLDYVGDFGLVGLIKGAGRILLLGAGDVDHRTHVSSAVYMKIFKVRCLYYIICRVYSSGTCVREKNKSGREERIGIQMMSGDKRIFYYYLLLLLLYLPSLSNH